MNLATFILVSVPLGIQFFARKYREDDLAETQVELSAELGVPRIRSYDFIVVGAGTAGCTVAGRLSDKFSVLLLEIGGSPVPQVDVPAFLTPVNADLEINYFFTTVPQPNVGQAQGGVLRPNFGKMLGGSGSHNHMVHNRGHPRDFELWASLVGDPSWQYGNVLHYFKKSEDFVGELLDEGEEDNYGHEGPLTVDTFVTPIGPAWFEAGRELGFEVGDPNGRQRESFAPLNMMLSGGRRVSAYTGFVKPVEGTRGNLTVLRYSAVEEILIDESGRAFGVAFSRHGLAQRAYANKEIVLSAGSVCSPLLLMKSGVGPADVLAEAGIPVKVQRPGVGRNLGEHTPVRVGPIYINDTAMLPRIDDGDEAELERYHETGEGQLGEISEGPQAFIVSSRAKAAGENDWPDIVLMLNRRYEGVGPAVDGQEYVYMYVINGRTRQRGSIRLNGTAWLLGERDDQRLAVIDPQLLTDPSDVAVLVEGIKVGLSVFENTTVFQRAGGQYANVAHQQCLDLTFRSDEYWKCYILWQAGSSNHYVGTNSMGRVDDPNAVVDSKLRVIGVGGLRIIDASVMPVVPNAHINAPTLMVAEKGADEILRAHGAA